MECIARGEAEGMAQRNQSEAESGHLKERRGLDSKLGRPILNNEKRLQVNVLSQRL